MARAATKRSGPDHGNGGVMLSKPALQAILRIAYPQRAGGVILLAMDLHRRHHLDKAHANRAPASDLPGVRAPTAGCSPSR